LIGWNGRIHCDLCSLWMIIVNNPTGLDCIYYECDHTSLGKRIGFHLLVVNTWINIY